MKHLFTAIAVVAALTLSSAAFGQESEKTPYIEVSTRVEKQITPDLIYIGIKINEQESKGKVKIEEKEKQMILMLKELNIDVEKDLTVDDMSSDIQKYFLKKANILASKSYTLTVKKADEAMAVMDALNSINIPDVELKGTAISPELEKEVKDELLVAAAQKAKENAAILAEALGSKAGKVIYIQNHYNFAQTYGANFTMRSVKAMAVSDEAASYVSIPSLEVSKTPISINIICHFAIE